MALIRKIRYGSDCLGNFSKLQNYLYLFIMLVLYTQTTFHSCLPFLGFKFAGKFVLKEKPLIRREREPLEFNAPDKDDLRVGHVT